MGRSSCGRGNRSDSRVPLRLSPSCAVHVDELTQRLVTHAVHGKIMSLALLVQRPRDQMNPPDTDFEVREQRLDFHAEAIDRVEYALMLIVPFDEVCASLVKAPFFWIDGLIEGVRNALVDCRAHLRYEFGEGDHHCHA